jgi:hypothetical protein
MAAQLASRSAGTFCASHPNYDPTMVSQPLAAAACASTTSVRST